MIVIFAGTSNFAVPSLEALLAAGVRVPRVYTQPDRPAGRGRLPRASPVKTCALAHGIEICQPLRAEDIIDELRALAPDLMVVAAYGLLLPPAVLRIPGHGCVNVHASLLPRWRGAAPVARAIEAGDDTTGVSLMQMDAGLDTGPILAARSTAIGLRETAGALHDRLAALGAALLGEQLNAIARGQLTARPQIAHGVSYATKLRKAEARLDWRLNAALLARQVRAFNPWPVAWTTWLGEPLRIWQATAVPAESGAAAGEIVATGHGDLRVACGDGALDLGMVQRRGGRPLAVADFLNGAELNTGMHFQ